MLDNQPKKGRQIEDVFRHGNPPESVSDATLEIIHQAAAEAMKDTGGPSLVFREMPKWPEAYEGFDKVFVYDQFSTNPMDLREVHFLQDNGHPICVAIGGGHMIGWDPEKEDEPLPNLVRRNIVEIFGATEEGLVPVEGEGTSNPWLLYRQFSGPFLGRPADQWEGANSGLDRVKVLAEV